MSDRSRRFSELRVVLTAGAAAASLACLPAFAAESPPEKKPAGAAEAVTQKPATPTIASVRCKGLDVHVTWKGTGVGVVDYYGAGVPVLQVRQDPSPAQTSTDITLGKEWEGRKIDVRIWDKDVKLLDTKSVECKAAP